MTEHVKEELRKLNLVDRFLFDEAMEKDGVYENTVSILMEQEIELLGKAETEKELRVSSQLRAIRLDVISADVKGKVYYTEMQKRDTKNLTRRSRYYQAQLDVSLLEPGTLDFNKLNDSCMIMIAPFDLFGRGLYRYTFEGTCRECPDLSIQDGAWRIFINTKGTNKEDFSQEFLDFMEYITDTSDEVAAKTESKRIKQIHENVQKIRVSEKAGVKYLQKWEEIALEKQESYESGMEAIINICNTLIKEGKGNDALRLMQDENFRKEQLKKIETEKGEGI